MGLEKRNHRWTITIIGLLVLGGALVIGLGFPEAQWSGGGCGGYSPEEELATESGAVTTNLVPSGSKGPCAVDWDKRPTCEELLENDPDAQQSYEICGMMYDLFTTPARVLALTPSTILEEGLEDIFTEAGKESFKFANDPCGYLCSKKFDFHIDGFHEPGETSAISLGQFDSVAGVSTKEHSYFNCRKECEKVLKKVGLKEDADKIAALLAPLTEDFWKRKYCCSFIVVQQPFTKCAQACCYEETRPEKRSRRYPECKRCCDYPWKVPLTQTQRGLCHSKCEKENRATPKGKDDKGCYSGKEAVDVGDGECIPREKIRNDPQRNSHYRKVCGMKKNKKHCLDFYPSGKCCWKPTNSSDCFYRDRDDGVTGGGDDGGYEVYSEEYTGEDDGMDDGGEDDGMDDGGGAHGAAGAQGDQGMQGVMDDDDDDDGIEDDDEGGMDDGGDEDEGS